MAKAVRFFLPSPFFIRAAITVHVKDPFGRREGAGRVEWRRRRRGLEGVKVAME